MERDISIKKDGTIHLMGICGTGMAGLAGLLMEKGYKITGSDQNMYPPMSDYIRGLGIHVMEGYGPQNLMHVPDLVIVGNVITRQNPEAEEMIRLGLPHMSFPQALKEFALKDRYPIVVAGTHGKTTTTSALAWILSCAGKAPGYLVGGIPMNFLKNFNLGKGPYFVIEGDEYDTAFFDKRPKFLHYMPRIVIITSVEFDHADIYRDYEHVLESFRSLLRLIPEEGVLVINNTCKDLIDEAKNHKFTTLTYGMAGDDKYRLVNFRLNGDFTNFEVYDSKARYDLNTRLCGEHNLLNLTAALAVARILGIDEALIKNALLQFKGVKRRQEVIGVVDEVTIIDDFAHHPTAVRETLLAVRKKYNPRRLIAVFEPRSNSSRRNVFQDQYVYSLGLADLIIVPEPVNMAKIPIEERFSSERLAHDLNALGKDAHYFREREEILGYLTGILVPGDLVLFMSNGDFDGLPLRLFEDLVMGHH